MRTRGQNLRGCLLLGLAGTAVLIMCLLLPSPQPPLSFTSGTWKSGAPEDRGRMVNDLLQRHELVGRTRLEVCELLGEPDSEGKCMIYHLGYMGRPKGAPFSFPYRLILQFNDRGVTSQATVDD